MNNFTTAFFGLLQSLQSANYQNGAPKGRGNEQTVHKKSGKTRRGATHKQGNHFLGRRLMKLTPAQYRHTHQGNPSKAVYEKMRLESRKWISA